MFVYVLSVVCAMVKMKPSLYACHPQVVLLIWQVSISHGPQLTEGTVVQALCTVRTSFFSGMLGCMSALIPVCRSALYTVYT